MDRWAPGTPMTEKLQMLWLFVLAAPIACVAWTVTHEEVFSEFHDWCEKKSRTARTLLARKFFYLFTCEYCFSHYVAAAVVWMTGYRLLVPGLAWRGARLVHPGVGGERLYEPVRQAAPRHQARARRNQSRGKRSRTEVQATLVVERRSQSRRNSAASTSGAHGLKKNAASPSRARARPHRFRGARGQHHHRNILRARIRRRASE